ncbi:hypothetical protein LCGC14_2332360, partial [marine sediment metagenome]
LINALIDKDWKEIEEQIFQRMK